MQPTAKKIAYVLAAIALGLTAPAVASEAPQKSHGFIGNSFDRQIADVQDLIRERRYTVALSSIRKLRASGKREAVRKFHEARILLKLKQYSEAEEANSEALRHHPGLHAARYNQACALALSGDVEVAMERLRDLAADVKSQPNVRKNFYALMETDTDLNSLRKRQDFKDVHELVGFGMPAKEYKIAAKYSSAIQQTSEMVGDSEARRLVNNAGLDLMNVTWEDTGRYKGSSVGPNISDMTIQVGYDNPITGEFQHRLMPVIRFDNFSDKTADIDPRDFTLLVGNEKGDPLQRISLYDFLENPRDYLHDADSWKGDRQSLLADRDSKVLVSAQAAFLPVPLQGKAEFNPVLFNYQSVPNDPAVLTILVTPEGTSTTIIDNQRDAYSNGSVWGQRLFYNDNGERASLQGERKSEVLAKRKAGIKVRKQTGAQVSDDALNMMLVIQVPLKRKRLEPEPSSDGFLDDFFGDDEVEYEAGDYEEALADEGYDAGAPMESTVEEAVISYGETEGPFTEIAGLEIERDTRFPVRVTVQFYKATSNGVVSAKDVKEIRKQIDSVYNQSDYVGSLVTGGQTGRVTEYEGSKVQPANWWGQFWQRYEDAYQVDRRTARRKLVKLIGKNYESRPVTELYLRNLLAP